MLFEKSLNNVQSKVNILNDYSIWLAGIANKFEYEFFNLSESSPRDKRKVNVYVSTNWNKKLNFSTYIEDYLLLHMWQFNFLWIAYLIGILCSKQRESHFFLIIRQIVDCS